MFVKCCPTCKVEFTSEFAGKKYCTLACKPKYYQGRTRTFARTCLSCKAEFVTTRLKKKYCCPNCCRTYYQRQTYLRNAPRLSAGYFLKYHGIPNNEPLVQILEVIYNLKKELRTHAKA